MDDTRFDALTRLLSTGSSRRGVISVLLGGSFGLLGLVDIDARRKKKKKRRKKKRKPAPTCTDGIRNGRETGSDCGGDCPRCANGQRCATRDDCASARCSAGVCQPCTGNVDCGTDSIGICLCDEPEAGALKVCLHAGPVGDYVTDCADCPPGLVCVASAPGAFDCLGPCGVVDGSFLPR